MLVPFAVGSVFCGCQLNVFSLELLVGENVNIGYGLTFIQFVFVALCSLPFVVSWKHRCFRPRRIRTRGMLAMCALFWLSSALNNVAFAYKISLPIHMTFRSLSLVVNIVLGTSLFRKRYSAAQLICAALITVGIVIITFESSNRDAATHSGAANGNSSGGGTGLQEVAAAFYEALTSESQIGGVLILTATVLLATSLGLAQDILMKEARNVSHRAAVVQPPTIWAESLFYVHALTAPLFFLKPIQLLTEVQSLTSSSSVTQMTLMNCVTQFLCVTGVHQLADLTSSFTVTLVTTLRKFASLTVSVIYFGHASRLTYYEWIAIVMVAVAGVVYPFVPKREDGSKRVHASADVELDTQKVKDKKQE